MFEFRSVVVSLIFCLFFPAIGIGQMCNVDPVCS